MHRAMHMGLVFALAVHLVFGCCAHHAHATCASIPRATAEVVEAHCHHDHDGGAADSSCQRRSPERPCDAARCVFTASDGKEAPSRLISPSCLKISWLRPSAELLTGNETLASTVSPSRQPVALHLLNQILLI